ncbi:flavin-containing monooxygenase [Rhodococcus koreensis]|uniref:flavin-containing monooxygenase n=1 Tax=Rhodococcus koreensis TaxID=99653 RepID=UPI003670BAD4
MTLSSDGQTAAAADVDVIVIGAGFGGLTATYRMRERGLDVLSFERGLDVGGTWYWNRYPGARTDSEGSFYRLNLFDDIVEPFSFKEKFPAQPEVLAYLGRVADELDLRKHYRFGVSVDAVVYDESTGRWQVRTDDGQDYTAKYVVSAVGIQSEPLVPDLPGRENFGGRIYHTAKWPADPVDLDGCRIAVIGTGSSGIQIIPQAADVASKLYVLQRTPTYSVPMVNKELTEEEQRELIESLPEIRKAVRDHPFSMPYSFSGRSALDVTDEERDAIYGEGWAKGGFRFMIESFDDIGTTKEANDTVSEWLRAKIHSIVEDPVTAAKLTPNYPYTVKRPPSGVEFFESFNKDHVELIALRESPLVSFSEKGLVLEDRELEVDVVILATGFDFVTGSLYKLNVQGRGGLPLSERWADGLSNYLSVTLHGFPNFFVLGGPLYPGGNWPTVAEEVSTYIANVIAEGEKRSAQVIETKAEVEEAWVAHVNELASQSLMAQYGKDANAYGLGANIEGKLQSVFFYLGGAQVLFDQFDHEAASGYPGFEMS